MVDSCLCSVHYNLTEYFDATLPSDSNHAVFDLSFSHDDAITIETLPHISTRDLSIERYVRTRGLTDGSLFVKITNSHSKDSALLLYVDQAPYVALLRQC